MFAQCESSCNMRFAEACKGGAATVNELFVPYTL
jgi:hypothetical protein